MSSKDSKIKLCLVGASGRMGRLVLDAIESSEHVECVSALVSKESSNRGKRYKNWTFECDVKQGIERADALLDFSAPSALSSYLDLAQNHKTPVVLGSTGLSKEQLSTLDTLANHAPLLVASNFSLGVNALFLLSKLAGKMLNTHFDVEIIESHHKHKKDAPSGTALSIGEAIASGRNVSLDSVKQFSSPERQRQEGKIGFSSVRAGDIVGEHTALFCSPQERIELFHRAEKRSVFANGALEAVKFLVSKPAGRYSMFDVLGVGESFT